MSTADPIFGAGFGLPHGDEGRRPEADPDGSAELEALLAVWPRLAAEAGGLGAADGLQSLRPPAGEPPAEDPDPVAQAREVDALAWDPTSAPRRSPGSRTSPDPASRGPLEMDAALLGDVAFALTEPAPGVRAHVEAAARAAFAASLRPLPSAAAAGLRAGLPERGASFGAGPALRTQRPARPTWALVRAAAALLLVGLGLLALVGPRAAQAGPVLVLDGLERFSLASGASRFHAQGALTAHLGQRFAAGLQELLSLHLSGGGRLVLAQGEALDVARLPRAEREAVLRLTAGEVLLDTRQGPAAVLLARPADGVPFGLLEVEGGAAHVALGLGPDGGPAVALMAGARARFTPVDGPPLTFEGPTHVALSGRGLSALGPPAQALFHELELLGGPLARPASDPFVEARRWRVLSGRGVRGGVGLSLRPAAARGADDERSEVLLGWLPDPSVLSAGRLRLMLQGPAGLSVALPDLLPDGAIAGRLEPGAEGAEPGLVTLEVALPAGWAERLAGRELRLALRWPEHGAGAASWVRWDGAAFAQARAPGSVLPEGR